MRAAAWRGSLALYLGAASPPGSNGGSTAIAFQVAALWGAQGAALQSGPGGGGSKPHARASDHAGGRPHPSLVKESSAHHCFLGMAAPGPGTHATRFWPRSPQGHEGMT